MMGAVDRTEEFRTILAGISSKGVGPSANLKGIDGNAHRWQTRSTCDSAHSAKHVADLSEQLTVEKLTEEVTRLTAVFNKRLEDLSGPTSLAELEVEDVVHALECIDGNAPQAQSDVSVSSTGVGSEVHQASSSRAVVVLGTCGQLAPQMPYGQGIRQACHDRVGGRGGACVAEAVCIADLLQFPFVKPDQSGVFVITYSQDWGVVFEEHMIQVSTLGRRIEDYIVTDSYGFCADIATSSEVPDPSRFPLRFVWKGLPGRAAEQQCMQLHVPDPQEFVRETNLLDLALKEPPTKLKPWETEKPETVAARNVENIQGAPQTISNETSWVVLDI